MIRMIGCADDRIREDKLRQLRVACVLPPFSGSRSILTRSRCKTCAGYRTGEPEDRNRIHADALRIGASSVALNPGENGAARWSFSGIR